MKIKLIAVDLDGTLLNDKQEISYGTKEALQKASRSGIKIVPCSGRPFPGIKEYLDQLDRKILINMLLLLMALWF